MLSSLVYVLGLSAFGIYHANALPSGPPLSTCNSLRPAHAPNSQNLNYLLSASSATFSPGQVLTITLNRQGSAVNYRGLMMQVRNRNQARSGSFSLPNNGRFQLLNCPGTPGSTIAHNSRVDKGDTNFMWTAPSSCETSEYTVRATVVNVFVSFQTDLSTSLTCVPLPIPPAVTMTLLPPPPAVTTLPLLPGCQFPTVVPANKYTTSFEGADPMAALNGWNNMNGGWTRRSGPTPSFGTGPAQAIDGTYYLYFEASFPRRVGDRALLQSDQDLRGCFCLSFSTNQNIRNNDASLGVFANDDMLYFSRTSQPQWQRFEFSLQTSVLTRIRFQYTRGRSFQGDIAIDQLAIAPGRCSGGSENNSS